MKWILALLLPLAGALFLGCPSLDGIAPPDDDDLIVEDDTGDDDASVASFKATIEAKAPVVGTFILGEDIADKCVDVKTCEVTVSQAKKYTMTVESDGFLFPDKIVEIDQNGDQKKVDWSCPGCWGVGVNGTYEDDCGIEDNVCGTNNVETSIQDGNVVIFFGFAFIPVPMAGYSFDGVDEYGWRLKGQISGDLSMIEYTMYDDAGIIRSTGKLTRI
jgi:hypothetical protein